MKKAYDVNQVDKYLILLGGPQQVFVEKLDDQIIMTGIVQKGQIMLEYELGSIVEMKKPHACTVKATGKKANAWEITRLGADIKIRCTNCNHEVMMSRFDFNKKIKKVLK